MAGNKMSSKSKAKDLGKLKSISQQNDENDNDEDLSLLRKPIMANTTGFARAKKIFDVSTQEIKELMAKECDLIYECKVCRSMFRSLVNFISHKRVFCRENFDQRSHGHFAAAVPLQLELQKLKCLEKAHQEALKKSDTDIFNLDEERIPMTKDLSTVIEKLTNTKGIQESEAQTVMLQKIPSSSAAVFQNINLDEHAEGSTNTMRAQVLELEHILSQDKAVLQSDGKFTIESSNDSQSEDVIHISDDDTEVNLKCKKCNIQFATAKTMRFHMKYKHEESRLVYPCPDCLDIFSNSWSVYRHLFKVHRKSAAQIRRLRESIQAKAFKMNNPPASYERRRNGAKPAAPAPRPQLTEDERRDRENQAWMDNMESDGSAPRCGGCGRGFFRRAALHAHTATCGRRGKALARGKRIEIQIRKDYNKGPGPAKGGENGNNNKLGEDENAQCSFSKPEEKETLEEAKMFIDGEEQTSNSADKADSSSSPAESPEKPEEITEIPKELADKPKIKLLFTMQAEKLKNNLIVLKQVIKSKRHADLESFECKKCETKCVNINEICEHMAGHYKWMRYACKLCNYRNYFFEQLADHVRAVHKLKGDADFYYSTVKAINGTEAMVLAEVDEAVTPVPRRPSRGSSDSSRLSDDSSNSAKPDRKRRKMTNPRCSTRKKEVTEKDESDNSKSEAPMDKVMQAIFNDKNQQKSKEDETSEGDDQEEKSSKQTELRVVPRRPVRNRAKRKNEDFEYDLSNLLKMEAQGYRDSISTVTSKVAPPVPVVKPISRKKSLPDTQSPLNNEILSNDYSGALLMMSKKSVDVGAAHMKSSLFATQSYKNFRLGNTAMFARPLIPKFASRAEKLSPKRLVIKEEKLEEASELEILNVGAKPTTISIEDLTESPKNVQSPKEVTATNREKANGDFVPAMVPIKIHRDGMEVLKNPVVNKNLSEISKTGMKKILLIKPINKNAENLKPMKFQRIKLKDPTKAGTLDKNSVLVKVPPVVVSKAEQADAVKDKDLTPDENENTSKSEDNKEKTIENSTSNIAEIKSEASDEMEVDAPA